MNADLKSLQRLNESQYANIGRTVQLLTAIEYDLFRTISAARGITEQEKLTAARGTFKQRKDLLRTKLESDLRFDQNTKENTFKKLDTASELREQFFHGLWVPEGGKLICKYIKRHAAKDRPNNIALQQIEMSSEKFTLIHKNLEYILIELNVIQEILGEG